MITRRNSTFTRRDSGEYVRDDGKVRLLCQSGRPRQPGQKEVGWTEIKNIGRNKTFDI